MSRSINEEIEELARYQAGKSFIQFKETEEEIEEGLGIAIAHWAEWDGVKIMKVFSYALDDANFHGEASQVADMIEAAEKEA